MGGEFKGVVRPRRMPHARGGQALIEFAVVLPLFLLCLIGALDAGLWAVQTSAEAGAVEQGAMIASSAGSSATAQTAPGAPRMRAGGVTPTPLSVARPRQSRCRTPTPRESS